MDMTTLIGLLILCQLLALSAFFSGAETALFSLTKLQLRRVRQQDARRGAVVVELLEHPHRLLSTILLCNTVTNITASVVGYMAMRRLEIPHAEAWAVPVMTVLLLLFGEISPKSLAIRSPEYYALRLAIPIRWVVRYTSTVRHAAEVSSAAILRWLERLPYFSGRKARAGVLTEEEYRTVLQDSEHAGVLRKEERAMVNKILALEETQVKEIMTPRVDMQCVRDDLSRAAAVTALQRIKHRRVPVIHETPDNVVGILHVKDFLINSGLELAAAVETANFVPETQTVARLFRDFRKKEHPVAVVVDEHGGTAGLVTMEDILEEIIGEIEDEFDASEIMVQTLGQRQFIINGKARLELVNEVCGTQLEAEDAETIAGWMIERLGTLPHDGDRVMADHVRLTARKVTKNRVREVLLEVTGETND